MFGLLVLYIFLIPQPQDTAWGGVVGGVAFETLPYLTSNADVAGPQTTPSSSVLSLSTPTHSLSFSEGPNFSRLQRSFRTSLYSLPP